jgi:hypothetical protein
MNTPKKDFIEDGMTTEEIRKQVKYIREYLQKGGKSTKEDKIEHLKNECSAFYQRYPMLFDMTTSDDFSFDNLNYFLEMREKIVKDKMSSQEASEEIGKEWFNKFVDLSKLEKK